MSEEYNNKSIQELLIRLDERTAAIKRELTDLKIEVEKIKEHIKDDNDSNRKSFVTKEEFAPIQRSIYGIATLIITTVVGTLVSMVVHKP